MKPREKVETASTPAFADAETLATRASLLGRLKDLENQGSWQEFFDTYWRLIYSTALKAGLTPEEAQDATQDTFVAVAKNIGAFRYDPARCSFKSWLLLITRQRIIWQLRKRPPAASSGARRVNDSTDTATIERIPDEASLNLDAHWESEWEKNLMAAALEAVKRRVKPKQFQIFDLYALQNWPVQDIARTLKVSAAQVYLAKHRVASLLKKETKRVEAAAR
ncbi:MAG: sigma-70 family RNA polymerase sigma factor [Verrucomicrobiales bacterium]|nr:sigma-70 family RNA polymerase sigma factor [Verrucomicrobiales bacterium]